MKKYKSQLIGLAILAIGLLLLFYLGEIILPFILGLSGAYFINPHIKKIQQFISNRAIAVTVYLLTILTIIAGSTILFGNEIVKDFERLNDAFTTFTKEHQTEIDETNQEVQNFISEIYYDEDVQSILNDTTTVSTSDESEFSDALGNVVSFFESDEEEEQGREFNWFIIFLASFGYFIYMLYDFNYFEEKYKKYFSSSGKGQNIIQEFFEDFRRIFLDYFQRRSWIVLICMTIFITTFLIMGIPGAILIGFIAGLLCYIAHFQYFALIPLSLSCLIMSIENGESFFLYFGIVLGVFILVSILEELVLYPKIMEHKSGINPAILAVSFAIWTHIFGTVIGGLIALPLTTIMLIYLDRLLLYLKEHYRREEGSDTADAN
ncbi:MAG: AI-2E family transporter [Flavobacteriales bacterium]|nr:AI-2E family transporter [Flavobacteriales bacterium]